MDKKDAYLKRIRYLLELSKDERREARLELVSSTLSILIQVYGQTDPRTQDYIQARTAISGLAASVVTERMSHFAYGALVSAEADVDSGLVESLERQYSGFVISDFVVMARAAMEDGAVQVAAVLACAALEDALKRTGELGGLPVSELHMPEVISELVKSGSIAGPQSKLVRSFVPIRNKVMHAEFDKIDSADVKAVIGFTEEFILKNLSA